MSNSILTPQVITNELLRRFENNLGFAKVVHHEDYSEHFAKPGAKIGDTLSLREPVRLAAVDGAQMVVQDVDERKIPLVINERKHTAFQFDSAEQTLSIDKIGDRYIESAAVSLANAAEVSGLTMAYRNTPNSVGTAGATPNTLLTYLQAGEALDRNATPMDGERFVVIPSKFQTSIVDALKGLFQSTEQVKRQYIRGRMGTAVGFDWIMAQNVRTHLIGTPGGTALVNGANQSGSSLIIDGTTATTGYYKAGDIITLGTAGTSIYATNPVSLDTLSDLRQFTILNDVYADGSGNMTLNIYPQITLIGDPNKPNPYATVSGAVADNTAVTLFGTAGTLSPQALAFHKEAYAWACVPLDLPRSQEMAKRATNPDTGVSIRTVAGYNIDNDVFAYRCDIMYGWVATRKDWGCRVIG